MIMRFFSSRPDHPLGEAKEVERALADLPPDNAFKTVDEIYGWFSSLQSANDFRTEHLFDVIRQLDEAAQASLRRLSRDYLLAARLSKSDERRIWTICYNYWGEVASLYARCVEPSPGKKGDPLKGSLALAATRLMAARTTQLKWVCYRYGPIGEDLWRGLGQPFLAAVAGAYAQKPVQLYPGQVGLTSVTQQYLQALVSCSSSMDSLLPLEIELADRLIAHLQSGFVFSTLCLPESVHWVDAANGSPPTRLARRPEQLSPSLRFFSPGSAPEKLTELIRGVELGKIPDDLNLGGDYPAAVLLPVLRHLALYWAHEPPRREHTRHAVKTRIAVLHGFDDCFTVFAGDLARLGKERVAESWVVEDVSRGGLGAGAETAADWLLIGTLLAMQPEGGDNWVLGVIRRYTRDAAAHIRIGIQALGREAASVELRPRSAGLSATGAIPGIWLRDASAGGEARLVLPPGSFAVRLNVDFMHGGQRYFLTPIELEKIGGSVDIGRYRLHLAE